MKLATTIFVVVGSLLFIGCDEDVIAVVGTGRPYSLYGVLSPQLDSQWVRVFPVEDLLEPAPSGSLGAQFMSVDLQSGEQFVWRDSLIVDPFGQAAHVFWAPFRAEYQHQYRLTVKNASGDETAVEVTVPSRTEIVLGEATIVPSIVRQRVHIEGNAPRLLRIEVIYTVGYKPSGQLEEADEVSIAYDGAQEPTSNGWVIPIELDDDFREVSETLGRRLRGPIDREYGLVLTSMILRLIVANEEWNPPGGTFDLDVLIQPDAMTNVENGFGFVGAGYRLEATWLPSEELIDAAGFRVPSQ